MPFHRLLLVGLLFGSAFGIGRHAHAVEINGSPQPKVMEWQKALEKAERVLNAEDVSDERLTSVRENLIRLESDIQSARDTAIEQAKELKHDLDALGPPPAEGVPAEAAGVASRRKRLNEDMANAEGIAKEGELLIVRAERAVESIKQLRRIRYTERILMRTQSPLNPALWAKALPEWSGLWSSSYDSVVSGLSQADERPALQLPGGNLAAGVGMALMLAIPVRLWLARRVKRLLQFGRPTEGRRLLVALLTTALHAWLPAMAAVALYLSLALGQELAADAAALAKAMLDSAMAAIVIAGFSLAALRPRRPDLRLVTLSDAGARAIHGVVIGLTVLFALDHVVSVFLGQRDVNVEVITLQNLVFGAFVSLLLAGLLRPVIGSTAESGMGPTGWLGLQKLLKALIVAIIVSALLGYSALSRLLAGHMVISIVLLVLVWLSMRVGEELVSHLLSAGSRTGIYLQRQLALSEDGAEMLGFWLGSTLKGLILVAGFLGLQLLWSLDQRDALLWLERMFHGFKLGGMTISLADILLGLLMFALLLISTRLIQRALDQRVFPRTRLDVGIRHSIHSSLGYAGFSLAALAGISIMGIDLSSLAVIAGALSVGIGFGLQNVVNNFVSGLILLIERPIKAGDWVVVGEHQGHVRQISIRATEIVTFDRASVFIPNSSLISGTVMNRTYADKTGRVLLTLGIDYGADPSLARSVMLDIARANPNIRDTPSPLVMMTGFGESAINLELIAFVHDVDNVKSVTSELCFAIHSAFREHGIGIPYPQREVSVTFSEAQLGKLLADRVSRRGG
jgi:small-conductance mechanosensitive channel